MSRKKESQKEFIFDGQFFRKLLRIVDSIEECEKR